MSIIFDSQNNTIEQGTWTEYSGSKFLVASSNSLKFQRALANLQRPYRKAIEKGTLDPGDGKRILCKAMAQALVLDWDNVIDSKHKKVPFTVEACNKALMGHEGLREFIQEFSTDLENFRNEEIVEEGNA